MRNAALLVLPFALLLGGCQSCLDSSSSGGNAPAAESPPTEGTVKRFRPRVFNPGIHPVGSGSAAPAPAPSASP